MSTIEAVQTLKKMYSRIELIEVKCDVTQATLAGNVKTTLNLGGSLFVGMIPSGKDTDIDSGTNTTTIVTVPRKKIMPLSTTEQSTREFTMDLSGYELDLAQDPRRNQGPVFWVGNSGVGIYSGSEALPIVAIMWRGKLKCSGSSTLW